METTCLLITEKKVGVQREFSLSILTIAFFSLWPAWATSNNQIPIL